MKKIFNIVTVCAGVMFTAASCIGLDTPPYDRETDLTYWSEDPASAVAALNTCYTRLTGMSEMLNMEGASDNAYMKGLGETQPIANGSFSTDNGYVKSIWDGYYAGIRTCNELLTNIDKVPALEAGLKAIVCVGETLEQRELGYTETLLKFQTKMALTNVTAEQMKNVIIAYEPVWAIGTGVTATADQADEGNGYVRAAIAEVYGADVAETVTVQYGGSMNDGNAAELLAKANVDGGLIGGASLKTDKFTTIVKAANA